MASGPYASRKSAPPPPRRGAPPPRQAPRPAPPSNVKPMPGPPLRGPGMPQPTLPVIKPQPGMPKGGGFEGPLLGPPLRGPTPAPAPPRGMGEASLAVMVYGPDGKAYGSPLEARNAGVTNPLRQPPAGVPPVPYGRAANPGSDMPMPRPGMPPPAVLKPGGVPLPLPPGGTGAMGGMGKPIAPQMMSAPPPMMTPGPRFKKGGAINLKYCKVSTCTPSKKKSNW